MDRMRDGMINNMLEGKTIDKVYKDGKHLIIQTTDGHQVYIGWLEGNPVHVKTSVRIVLPQIMMSGAVGAFK